jgi:hypothetical protein
MVERRKEQLLPWKGTPRMREEDFCCYSDDEVRNFALDMRSLFIHDYARHLAICRRCQTRLESWTKLLSEFDRKRFARRSSGCLMGGLYGGPERNDAMISNRSPLSSPTSIGQRRQRSKALQGSTRSRGSIMQEVLTKKIRLV